MESCVHCSVSQWEGSDFGGLRAEVLTRVRWGKNILQEPIFSPHQKRPWKEKLRERIPVKALGNFSFGIAKPPNPLREPECWRKCFLQEIKLFLGELPWGDFLDSWRTLQELKRWWLRDKNLAIFQKLVKLASRTRVLHYHENVAGTICVYPSIRSLKKTRTCPSSYTICGGPQKTQRKDIRLEDPVQAGFLQRSLEMLVSKIKPCRSKYVLK